MSNQSDIQPGEEAAADQDSPDAAGHGGTAPYAEAQRRFILFWGEMASRWGINRTMAQIHALLYASEEALDTDQIMARLQISRGNANMNLRSLMDWNLVRKVHQAGSRKDYYEAEKNVWKITARVIQERERREIEPVMQQLQGCRSILLEGARDGTPDTLDTAGQAFYGRIDNLITLMQMFEELSEAFFPFIQDRSMEETRQLIALAREMTGRPADEGDDA